MEISGGESPHPSRLDIVIDPDKAVEALSQMPQSHLILNLYAGNKGTNYVDTMEATSMGYSVEGLLEDLYDNHDPRKDTDDAWDEDALERILWNETPATLEEEEFMRLWNVRSAMTLLSYQALWASNLPVEIQQAFSVSEGSDGRWQKYAGSTHMTNIDVDIALSATLKWFKEHEEQDTPITPDFKMEEQIRKVCTRFEELTEFYNVHFGELFPDMRHAGSEANDEREMPQRRYHVANSLAHVLGSDDDMYTLAEQFDDQYRFHM